jgi:hypothetical protein
MGLPLRRDVLDRLRVLWAEIPEVARPRRVQLHYLNGRIQVELFLDLAAAGPDGANAGPLRERLRAALAADPRFSRLTVWFG